VPNVKAYLYFFVAVLLKFSLQKYKTKENGFYYFEWAVAFAVSISPFVPSFISLIFPSPLPNSPIPFPCALLLGGPIIYQSFISIRCFCFPCRLLSFLLMYDFSDQPVDALPCTLSCFCPPGLLVTGSCCWVVWGVAFIELGLSLILIFIFYYSFMKTSLGWLNASVELCALFCCKLIQYSSSLRQRARFIFRVRKNKEAKQTKRNWEWCRKKAKLT
jgi:hypothetical protein